MFGVPAPAMLSSPAGDAFCLSVPESRTRTELLQKASREKAVLTIPAIYRSIQQLPWLSHLLGLGLVAKHRLSSRLLNKGACGFLGS